MTNNAPVNLRLSRQDKKFHPEKCGKGPWRIESDPPNPDVIGIRRRITVRLDGDRGTVIVIGMNPSVAGRGSSIPTSNGSSTAKVIEEGAKAKSDRTLTKVARVMNYLGFSKLIMINLCETVESKPENLKSVDIDGPLRAHWNNGAIFNEAEEIFIAWGIGPEFEEKKSDAKRILRASGKPIKCIGTHGANVRYGLHPRRWTYSEECIVVDFPLD